MAANDIQVGGEHYKKLDTQPWDVYEQWLGQDGFAGFLRGSCIKYLVRYKDKGGVQDLRKALHVLQKLVELESGGEIQTQKPTLPIYHTSFDKPYPVPNYSPIETGIFTKPYLDGSIASRPLRCVCYGSSISDPQRECPLHPFLIGEYP